MKVKFNRKSLMIYIDERSEFLGQFRLTSIYRFNPAKYALWETVSTSMEANGALYSQRSLGAWVTMADC